MCAIFSITLLKSTLQFLSNDTIVKLLKLSWLIVDLWNVFSTLGFETLLLQLALLNMGQGEDHSAVIEYMPGSQKVHG